MKVLGFLRSAAIVSACAGMLIPVHQLEAADSGQQQTRVPFAQQATTIHDVALQPGGRLTGFIVDANGSPRAEPVEVVRTQSDQVMQVGSTPNGQFAVEGLSAGVYQIRAEYGALVCRCWAPGTAPPAAAEQLLLVSDEQVQRGQRPIGEILFSPPVVIGALVAAAIAIPIALHNADDDAS